MVRAGGKAARRAGHGRCQPGGGPGSPTWGVCCRMGWQAATRFDTCCCRFHGQIWDSEENEVIEEDTYAAGMKVRRKILGNAKEILLQQALCCGLPVTNTAYHHLDAVVPELTAKGVSLNGSST